MSCSLSAQIQNLTGSAKPAAKAQSIAFDVASIREDRESFKPSSFPLSVDDSFESPPGHFHADFSLATYIEFAYKVWLTDEERKAMLAHLPGWVANTRFEILATAQPDATKDQYRLMMKNLLAERFKLKVHTEQREAPVLAMTLIRDGKPGPKLIPHQQGLPCDVKPREDTFPQGCFSYGAVPSENGTFLFGARATSMDEIGNFVGSMAGFAGEIGRRVVNQTGLVGKWDFTLQAAIHPQTDDLQGSGDNEDFIEALRNQLGLKLKPSRAVIPVLIVDSVEEPTAN